MRASSFIPWTSVIAGGLLSTAAHAVAPTNAEQFWLEIINRLRINPQAELANIVNLNPASPATWASPKSSDPAIVTALESFQVDPELLRAQWANLSPVGPLAWNSNLNNAAAGHNAQMVAQDQQSHQLPGEADFATRFRNAGYLYSFAGENVFAYAESIRQGHAAFAIDWGNSPGGIQNPAGHRNNLLDPNFREVGISIVTDTNPASQVGPLLVTQDFGSRKNIAFITGVIYNDTLAADSFYTPGEGIGGVNVAAYKTGTSALVASTPSSSSGGYALRLTPGVYDVKITGTGLAAPITYHNVAIYSDNVKIDSLSTWLADADGDWSNVANWSSGVPNGAGTVASLHRAIAAPRTISLNNPVSVGTLNLENPHGYTIRGSSSLTLEAAGPSRIRVIGPGSHTLNTFQVTAIDTTIDVSAGAALTIASPLLIGGSLTRSGAGTLHLANLPYFGGTPATLAITGGITHFTASTRLGHLNVSNPATFVNFQASQEIQQLVIADGTVALAPGGGKVLCAEQLSITAGQLDVGDNLLVVAASSSNQKQVLQAVSELVRSGWADQWTGDGIVSSAARDNAKKITGLVVVPNTDPTSGLPLLDTVNGHVISPTSILVRYGLNGDFNLDGVIDIDDYFRIDSGFITRKTGYVNGDLTLDGVIDIDDYFLIDSAFIGQRSLAHPALHTVPEPAALALLVAAALLVPRRKRL